MEIICPQCQARYQVPEERIKAGGTKVACARCKFKFLAKPANLQQEEVSSVEPTFSLHNAVSAEDSDATQAVEMNDGLRRRLSMAARAVEDENSGLIRPSASSDSIAELDFSAKNQAVKKPEARLSSSTESLPLAKASKPEIPEKKMQDKANFRHKTNYINRGGIEVSAATGEIDVPQRLQASPASLGFPPNLDERNSEPIVMDPMIESDTVVRPKREEPKPARRSFKVNDDYDDEEPLPLEFEENSNKKKLIPWIFGAAVGIALIWGVLQIGLPLVSSLMKSDTKVATKEKSKSIVTEEQKPTSPVLAENNSEPTKDLKPVQTSWDWFNIDLAYLKSFLVEKKMSTPEERSRRASALVIEGILANDRANIDQGTALAMQMLLADELGTEELLPAAIYGLLQGNRALLLGVMRAWPKEDRKHPYFTLIEFALRANDSKSRTEVFKKMNALLDSNPNFKLARDWYIKISLEDLRAAGKEPSDPQLRKMISTFRQDRQMWTETQSHLHHTIDALLMPTIRNLQAEGVH